jgi:hypothetical protein
MTTLCDGVALLGEVCFSTFGVEQSHGSCAAINKLHHFDVASLCMRSMVHQCRHLFNEDRLNYAIRTTEQKIYRLLRKRPHKVSGRHAFLRDLFAQLRPDGSRSVPQDWKELVMSRHGILYSQLSPAEISYWEQKATDTARSKAAAIEGDILHLEDALHLAKARAQEEFSMVGLMHRGSCVRFGPGDWDTMVALWNSGRFSASIVAGLRQKAMVSPIAPPTDVQQLFGNTAIVALDRPARRHPEWLSAVCQCRSELCRCVFLH